MSELSMRPTVIGGERIADDFGIYRQGYSCGRIRFAGNTRAKNPIGIGTSTRP
ncbi:MULTISPECIES: hypothetical protein [unclassified Bradyrhizobium]|uniref:hypothetical protein n=1 Tax=unclassified Bradyrhizobium TaxID=2631580 RepID=UPI002915C5CD|nr:MULTISPECIES: hypothetical protein [unclassified Bradyrhizobium]